MTASSVMPLHPLCSASRLLRQTPMERKHMMQSHTETSILCTRPHAAWSRAYTLSERTRRWQVELPPPGEEQAERARQRLLDWQAQKPFQDRAWFTQRLAQDGLTEAQVLALLATEPGLAEDEAGESPAWMTWLGEAFA